jgi:signal transduction histidine kinase
LTRSPLVGLACATLVVGAITLLIYPLQNLDPGVSSGVLYVLGVLLVATYWGLWPGLLTAAASVLALDYFHTSPEGKFVAGKDAGDLFAIGSLLVTEVVASIIADRARSRAEHAEQRLLLEAELRRRDAERIRLEEVQASRARVLTAADKERRRVVRDLHDGAQQRLVHTVVTLKLAVQAVQDENTADGDALVTEALRHAEQATTELRELAHGILPSVLTRGGLQAGLEDLASRVSLPFSADVSVGRLPPAIEATAYFVVAEALTNVVKHSGADSAEVKASVEGDLLRVEVRDNGVGGARTDGTGLIGIEDRLSTLDGRLRVESPHGGGTLIAAEIPVPVASPPG